MSLLLGLCSLVCISLLYLPGEKWKPAQISPLIPADRALLPSCSQFICSFCSIFHYVALKRPKIVPWGPRKKFYSTFIIFSLQIDIEVWPRRHDFSKPGPNTVLLSVWALCQDLTSTANEKKKKKILVVLFYHTVLPTRIRQNCRSCIMQDLEHELSSGFWFDDMQQLTDLD